MSGRLISFKSEFSVLDKNIFFPKWSKSSYSVQFPHIYRSAGYHTHTHLGASKDTCTPGNAAGWAFSPNFWCLNHLDCYFQFQRQGLTQVIRFYDSRKHLLKDPSHAINPKSACQLSIDVCGRTWHFPSPRSSSKGIKICDPLFLLHSWQPVVLIQERSRRENQKFKLSMCF